MNASFSSLPASVNNTSWHKKARWMTKKVNVTASSSNGDEVSKFQGNLRQPLRFVGRGSEFGNNTLDFWSESSLRAALQENQVSTTVKERIQNLSAHLIPTSPSIAEELDNAAQEGLHETKVQRPSSNVVNFESAVEYDAITRPDAEVTVGEMGVAPRPNMFASLVSSVRKFVPPPALYSLAAAAGFLTLCYGINQSAF
ncbi:hypothetical protein PROFUN_09213 [Planoprotostelium fungivorum]|uniref:Uncharacterized protein n=1 Tax=Planoprotostelium fungivorum TaxID=1890364 RepID=A0A2P6NHL1_9EUKA|nr:hypothetical protein PROFUN_09213 [Planoprotostelium fungivorum]